MTTFVCKIFQNLWVRSIAISLLSAWFALASAGVSWASPSETEPTAPEEYMFSVKITGQGRPVILLPGLMSSGEVWQSVAEHFQTQAQLHILTVAGFAGQPPVEDPSLQRLVDDLSHYIQANQLSAPIVVGHSLGGLTAMLLASQHPNLIGQVISIDGLPFIGPVFSGSNATTVEALAPQAQQMKHYFATLSAEQLAQQTQMGIHRQATHPQGQTLVIKMAKSSHPPTVSAMMFDVMNTDLREQIALIEQPLTLIGASGALPSEHAKDHLQDLYRQQLEKAQTSRLIMNDVARHFVMLDAPQWLNDSLEDAMETAL